MAQNIDEIYNELIQDERFKSLYPTQTDFVQFLENEPTADADIEQLFGVKSASEYLKKKDQPIIQNLGNESSSFQSLSVGQTEPIPQQTQGLVEQPQEGSNQNLGDVEDPYGLQAVGLPPLGYGKSFAGGPQPTKKVNPQVSNYIGALDALVKEARSKNDLGAVQNVLQRISSFQLDPQYSQFVKQGQFKNQYEQLNAVIAEVYSNKPMAFADKKFQDGITKLGFRNPVGAKPEVLFRAKQENIPTFLPKQPGAPFKQKTLDQQIKELETPKPLDQKSEAVVSYLSSYDEQMNPFEYDLQFMMGNNQNAGYEMSSEIKADYLTSQEQKFDKTFQADVNNMLESNAVYNLPANFFDNDAIISQTRELVDAKTGAVRTVTENVINQKRKLTTDKGIYMLDDAGNPKVNPIYLDEFVERQLRMPGGIASQQVVDAFNKKRKAAGLDEYTKEEVVNILKPRVLRLATIAAEQKLENTIVEDRLTRINIYEDEVEKVNRDLDFEVKSLVGNSQKLINNFKVEIVEDTKAEAERLASIAAKSNEDLFAQYIITAQNAASPELQNAAYQNYVQQVNLNATRYEEQVAGLRKTTEEKFKNYALQVEGDAKKELEAIQKKYGISPDKDEEGKLTTAAYRKYRDAFKKEYNAYKTQERANSDAMGWRLTDILQSGSARVFGNAIQALNAAVGYEDNPLTDLMKYLDFVQTKSDVAVKPFSQVLEEDGFFSIQSLKTAVQSTVQQGPNLALGIASTMLSGNPYIGGSLMWGYETIDQVGQNYRDVFARTGSILQAEDAAAQTLQTQILIAPIYTLSMLPFTKGFLSKMASGGNALGFTKKFGLGLALEASEEIPVEIAQNYLSYKFANDNPEKFATWLSKNGGNTALDVLPSIAVLGGGSAGMETYSERMTEQAKSRVLATLGRLGMSQTIADAVQVIGEGGVNILPEYLYRTQQIDAQELKDMKRAFGEVVKALPQAQELIRDQDHQKYYITLASEKARRQRQMEEAQDESKKKELEEVVKSIEKKMTDVATGKPQQLTKITFKDGGSVVLANDEMVIFLMNKKFLSDVADGSIQVATQDANINRIVEEQKKELETQLQEATDPGAKKLTAARTKAKERGATIKDGNKLNAVAEKARQNGQKNVDSILNQAAVLQSALTELAPGASIVFLNNDEYVQTMDEVKGRASSNGNFTYKKNDQGGYDVEIQINLDKATTTTIAHEVGHALLLRTLGSDPKLFDKMRAQLKNVIASKIDNRFLNDIESLLNNYSKIDQAEEFLVELVAVMVTNGKNLEISTIEKIAKVISDFVAYVTGGKVQLYNDISTRAEFVKFMNGMAETLRTGELAAPIQEKIATETQEGVQPTEEGQTQGVRSKAQAIGEDVISVTDYNEKARELAQAVKRGDMDAINEMAKEMAAKVPSNAVLVPMPSRTGKATNMKILAEAISKISMAPVADVLTGKNRKSLYEAKKKGETISPDDLKMELSGKLPEGKIPIIIDNVLATGATFRAAKDVIPNAKIIVHSVDQLAFSQEDQTQGIRSKARVDEVEATAKALEGVDLKKLDGLPKVYFHGSKKGVAQRLKFKPDELGIHFGTFETANKLAKGRGGITEGFVIDLKNPLKTERDFARWEWYIVSKLFHKDGIITDKQLEYVQKKKDNDALIKVLKDNGYDGIEYENFYEGGGKSIIAFDKNTIVTISEAYHKAKADGSNPELVKAVEELLGVTQEGQTEEEVIVDAVENPLSTEDVEGREIEPGYEVFDQPIVIDSTKGRTNRKPFRSKASIKRDFEINDDDFVDVDEINGKTMVGFMGDVQVTGSVTTPTGLTLRGFGGPNYPAQANRNLKKDKEGYYKGRAAVWASTFEDSTGKLMKRFKEAQGALIGAQQNSGILGNRLMLKYFGEELKIASEKINSEETIVNFINEKLKTQFKKDKKTGVASTFSEALGGVESFSSIDEFVDYLDPYFTSNQFVAKYPDSNNIVQKGDKKVTLLEANNTKKAERIVPYELRGALFVKMFNIDSHKKFGVPSIVPGKGYTYDKTVLEYANDTMFGEAGYGDFVGFVEFDPDTLKLEKVNQSSDFFNPSYEWVITAEKVRFKYFNEFLDGRALFYENTSASEKANQTPFGLRPKAAAARAIMGSQPTTTIDSEKVKERQKGFGSKSQLTEPSSDKWSPSLTQEQVDAKLAETGVRTKTENDRLLQETKKGNETQRNNISTYSAFVNGIIAKYGKDNLANKNILDAGAGLGIGAKAATQAGIANSYKTFEPFPSISDGKWEKFSGTQEPNFTDFGAIENNSQDILVNNAVLNVVPADIRQSIVENIGRVLKPGGQAYVSVRGIKESALMESLAAAKSGKSKNVFLSDSEYYVPGTQGDYQKGFSEVELQAYIQDVLGSQYDVQISKEPFWKSNANAPKVVITKKEKATGPFKSKSQLDFTQIRPEYDAVMNQQFGTKEAAYRALIEKGYTPKRIKEAIGLYDFDERAFKQAQGEIAINAINTVAKTYNNRQEEIKDAINQNLGNIEAIYNDLITHEKKYSNLEIFTAVTDMDFLSPQELIDIFGAEYRETVKRAINANTPYPTDFLEELEGDARTLKVSQKAADIADVVREAGLGIVDSAVAIDSLLEFMKTNGFDQLAIALTEAVKRFGQDRSMFQKGLDWADQVRSGQVGDNLYTPEAINYAFSVSSELFSQAGRILQLARYFNETNQLAMIERQLAASGVVLTEMQKKTLESLVNDYKTAQADNKEKLKALQEDWSDQAYEAFNESEKAVGMATIRVAQFLEARKPIFWNERLTSGAARALLNVSTAVLSLVANIENNIWSTNFVARTIQKLRDVLGSGIKGNTLSFANWRMARKLTSKRMWFDMNNNARFGVMDTSKGLNKYYDNLAQVNFFRDVKWNYNFMKAMVKKVLNRDFESMTPEEQADAYDLTLVKLKNGDIELRDGKTYTFARSLAWSLGTGPFLAAKQSNTSLLMNTGGPLFAEATGRIMSYGGDIGFGYMAAQRAMIDYFQNIQGTRFQDGIFGSMLENADGKLDEKTIRALSEVLRADAELYARFEQEGLKRTLLGDNMLSGVISLGRGQLRKKIRTLYTENRKQNSGSTLFGEFKREFLSGTGLYKNALQVLDVGFFTLMPFTKVPVNFLGSAIVKVVPYAAGAKYILAEGIYQYKYKKFNEKYDGIPALKTDKERRDYEKAKIDLFGAKRQATYDVAQFVTSIAIYGFAMSAVKAGAVLVGGSDEEKEKAFKLYGLKSGLYNATLHMEYLAAGMPSNFLARRGGFAKPGDVMLNINNAGFLGYAMGLYGSVYEGKLKQEANNTMSLFDEQKSAMSMLLTNTLSSGVETLPMFQGIARIGEAMNSFKKEDATAGLKTFVSGSLSTSMAVFFPSFFSFMSKGNAEMIQSTGDINKRAENLEWFMGDIGIRVIQKLNRNISFNENTRNDYYKAQIGPFGEDLSYKVTIAEPGTAGAYIQAFIDPFAIRTFASPSKQQQQEIQKYRESSQLFGEMVNLALTFKQITGQDFEWKVDGKTSSFFNIITNPMQNKFPFAAGAENVGGLDEPNTYKLFEYSLPNDLYRKELMIRGEEYRSAMRKYIGLFAEVRSKVQTAIEQGDEQRARRLITDLFEEYQSEVTETQKNYLSNYVRNREKQYLITLRDRKLITEEEKKIMIKSGFMTQEGLIP